MVSDRFLIAAQHEIVVKSQSPENIFLYSPSILVSSSGVQILSHDVGGDSTSGTIEKQPDFSPFPSSKQKMICRIHTRSVGDSQFVHRKSFPMCHARLFSINRRVFVIGHNGSVQLAHSDDDGCSWSPMHQITTSDGWHAAPCNVWQTRKRIYLCMERRSDTSVEGWNVAGLAPHVLSAPLSADLTCPSAWTVSKSYSFNQLFEREQFSFFGIPFMETGYKFPVHNFVHGQIVKSSPMGWLEGNVVQILDKKHVWFDPNNHTFHVFLRANTAGVGYCCVLKVTEVEENNTHALYTELARAPSGEAMCFIPLPGGHNKFHIFYDAPSERYWLCSNQATDSMTRLEHLPPKRYGLPNNERNRLVLHHSKNCVDWVFAGVVAIGQSEQFARNYPSVAVDQDDLVIATRSGDERALDSQYTNLIMLHRVKAFRSLVY